jgi:ubiquinol-cytochrome c reductase cytochrome b subunit
MPGWDWSIGDYTLVPNPFWGGAAFPLLVFAILFAFPTLERRLTRSGAAHNLLDRPRDAPWRTPIVLALTTWVGLVFVFGAADRLYADFGISYTALLWTFRGLIWVLPAAVLLLTRRICLGLQDQERIERDRELAEHEGTLEPG